jgi:phosphomannomutase
MSSSVLALSGGRTKPPANRDLIFLFDVDGTLTKPRLPVEHDMISFLYDLRDKVGEGVHLFFDFSRMTKSTHPPLA